MVNADLIAAKLVELADRVARIRDHQPETVDQLARERDRLVPSVRDRFSRSRPERSRARVWKWTLRRSALSHRCTKVTAPVRAASTEPRPRVRLPLRRRRETAARGRGWSALLLRGGCRVAEDNLGELFVRLRAGYGLGVSTLARRRYSYSDYLAVEAASDIRHEFLDGEIFAMAGGSPEHAALAGALTGILYGQLRGRSCRPYSSDLRVRIEETGLATYPDAAVVCGDPNMSPQDRHAVVNPVLLFEVLSPSTEDYDRGEKRLHYQRIPTLQAIVLIKQDAVEVEVWRRDGDVFNQERHGTGSTIRLPEDVSLPLDELYQGIV